MKKDAFLYQQVYDQIRNGLGGPLYPVGAMLPAEQELQAQYGVSAITIKKALGILVDEGYIRRVPGKGTTVLHAGSAPPAAAPQAQGRALIGVILEHVSTPFGLDMMYALDKLAEAAGHKLLIRFSYCDREKETQEIDFLLSQGVRGIIAMPSHGAHYNTALLKLALEDFPLVLVDKKLKGIPVPSVRTDNRAAIAALVRQAVADGHKNIAFISTGDLEATSTEERRLGFAEQMQAEGLDPAGQCIITASHDPLNSPAPAAVKATAAFLKANGKGIDALISAEFGLVRTFTAASRRLGPGAHQNIALYTIDDDSLAPFGPAFTHMKQDEPAIAATAFALLQQRLAGQPIEQEDHLIPALLTLAAE